MKKIWCMLFISFTLVAKSQNARVEKSIFGVQSGFLGIWVQNESRISNLLSLRSEIGFDYGFWGGTYYDGNANRLTNKTYFLAAPVLSVEPRFYYNLQQRAAKSKRIDNNSGNFLSLKMGYHPQLLAISNQKGVSILSDISIVPTWGMRRNIGKHFNYELGGGIGYQFFLDKNANSPGNIAINILLRIGYTL